MGRKSKYESDVKPKLEEIHQLYQERTEAEIAEVLGISVPTFEKYKREHKELRDCLTKAKDELISTLKESLKKKAVGFKYTETKKTIRSVDGVRTQVIEEFERYSPPDVGAIHLILKNIDPEWHNDDLTTIQMKKDKMEIDKQKVGDLW